jgi:hypothetical protein
MPSTQTRMRQTLRRQKRQTLQNGDRQYFAAVRKLRRDKIDKWQLEHKPERFKRRLAQLSFQASVRQKKQEMRDRAKG